MNDIQAQKIMFLQMKAVPDVQVRNSDLIFKVSVHNNSYPFCKVLPNTPNSQNPPGL